MGEPTTAELQAITKSFLVQSPPGEFMEVVTDLRGIVEDESILNAVIPGAFKEWNLSQKLQVENGDHKFIVCEESSLGGDEYYDGVSGEAVTFDHITRKVKGTRSAASGASDDKARAALQEEGEKYIYDHYADGTIGVYGGKKGLTIVISAAKFEPRNFWSGRWRSVWNVNGSTLDGSFDVHIHFYEDGNVQSFMKHEVKGIKVKGSGPAAIFKAIKAAEGDYQQKLDVKYQAMDSTTFKALRRQLPITASKIDWDKMAAGAGGNTLRAAAGKPE